MQMKIEKKISKKTSVKKLRYLIQKHEASHLHYDFRLELDGVLKSWAIAKGPSIDSHVKRLAIEVEDHPLDYGNFEGVIPQGNYGGGTVMLWDKGTWQPLENPHKQLESGKLSFILHGQRLQGEWSLVLMRKDYDSGYGSGNRNNWLLIKKDDEFAKNGDEDKILQTQFTSVKTGRKMDEIAKEEK